MSTISFQVHPSFRERQPAKIDRPNSRMYGVVAGMDVEATGHGVCCDVKALEQIAQLANQFPEGVSGRFGHPGMSENATGRKVQLAYNWRVLRGEKAGDPHTYLVHDSQFMDAARTSPAFAHDPVEYIMNMAEQHPKHFAESLVLSANQVWTTQDGKELPTWEEVEEDGYKYKRTRKRPENALTKVPVLRPTAVHFCDLVNDGAITHSGLYPMASGLNDAVLFASIFTEQNGPNYVLDHLFATVDDLRRRFNIPLEGLQPKVRRLLSLYIDSRQAVAETAGHPGGSRGIDGVSPVSPPLQPVFFESAFVRKNAPIARKDKQAMSNQRRQRFSRRERAHGASERGKPLVEAAVELSENEELAAEAEAALDQASAMLSQAEQMANSMVQSTVALQDTPALASAAQVAHLQEQVDQHTDQLHELTGHLKKLSELLVKNMEMTSALQRNLSRANGDPVVTHRVPVLGATGAFEGFQFQQPAPGAWAAGQQPTSVEQRREQLPAGLDPESAEARAIRVQQRRAAQQRQ
jgi:hypothetical protein